MVDVDLGDLQAETGLNRLRSTHDDKSGVFFREGKARQYETFEWSPEVLRDIEKLQGRGRVGLLEARAVERLKRAGRRLAGVIDKTF